MRSGSLTQDVCYFGGHIRPDFQGICFAIKDSFWFYTVCGSECSFPRGEFSRLGINILIHFRKRIGVRDCLSLFCFLNICIYFAFSCCVLKIFPVIHYSVYS